MLKINKAISGAESGSNANITFGDRVDPKTGKIFNPSKLITPEQFSGKPLSEMTIAEVYAFQKERNSQSEGSGAVGQYQFMPSTLKAYVEKLGIKPTEKFDAAMQQKLQNALLQDSKNTLLKAKISPTAENMYMAHYIGAGGAIAVHKAIKDSPNASVADVLVAQRLSRNPKLNPKDEKQKLVKHNPELAKTSVSDFEALMNKKLNPQK